MRGAESRSPTGRVGESVAETVRQRLAEIAPAIRAHGGDVELIDVSPGGVVTVRFAGMCTGCPFRPLTMAGTVRPALASVGGVTAVEASGTRISRESEERLAAYLRTD